MPVAELIRRGGDQRADVLPLEEAVHRTGGAREWRRLPECVTLLPVMAERAFVILNYVDKVPSMASCAKCQRKFFAPNTLPRDSAAVEQYLLEKFARHNCPRVTKERAEWGRTANQAVGGRKNC